MMKRAKIKREATAKQQGKFKQEKIYDEETETMRNENQRSCSIPHRSTCKCIQVHAGKDKAGRDVC